MIKQLKYKDYPINFEIYNSAAEVRKDCEKRKITNKHFHDMANKNNIKKSWEGVESYQEAFDLLRDGYQPTVEKLKNQIKADVSGEGKRISFANDVVGYAPIVPLAIMGVPNSMINTRIKKIKAKVVDIYYDGAFSCVTKTEDIIATGAKVLAQIISLEKQGYRFNLYQVQSYSDDHGADCLLTKIKSANQPLDLKRCSFPLTHTAYFRVIGFDWYSKCPVASYRLAYGHALCWEDTVNDDLPDMFKQFFGYNAVYISGNRLLNEDKPEEYLKGVLTNVSIH